MAALLFVSVVPKYGSLSSTNIDIWAACSFINRSLEAMGYSTVNSDLPESGLFKEIAIKNAQELIDECKGYIAHNLRVIVEETIFED